jgi:hypothetical protein
MDLKANFERRLAEVTEQLPLQLSSFIGQFEKREQLHL